MTTAATPAAHLAFVGTCQTRGMADVARALLPGARIHDFTLNAPGMESEILPRIEACDLVVTQVADGAGGGEPEPFSPAWLQARNFESIYVPPIVFTGFQPDMAYIPSDTGVLWGAYSPYHSQLIVSAFLLGLSEERTLRLFNTHIFAELGYLDAYAGSRAAVIAIFSAAGFDLAPVIDRLAAEGTVFMHTVNHPAIELLAPITMDALARAGVVERGTPAPPGVPDHLAVNMIVPVFPPIARRLGLEEADDFLQAVDAIGEGGSRVVTLPQYVARSFEIYRGEPRDRLEADSVKGTLSRVAALLAA